MDINTSTTPVQAGLTWALQKVRRAGGDRAGGYPGAAVIDAQLAQGLLVEDKPSVKRAISAMPAAAKTIRINAPNSVFALGNAFMKS